MSVLNDKQQIRDLQDRPTETVQVPEWSCDVRVQALSGRGREVFNEDLRTRLEVAGNGVLPGGVFWALVMVHTVVDESGASVFSAEDVDWLSEKNEAVLDRVAQVGLRLNGLGQAAAERAEKNSEAAPSGDSGSASLSSSAAP